MDINNHKNNVIFIDIRNSDEVFTKHFDGTKMTNFYNIPMNMIRFNKNVILQHLDYVEQIYIVCTTGLRSQFIKNKYFNNEHRVKVDDAIQFNKFNSAKKYTIPNNNKPIDVWVDGTFYYNIYNITRIIQIFLGTVVLLNTLYLFKYAKCKTTIPLYILGGFSLMALFNGLTNTCTISILLRDVLN